MADFDKIKRNIGRMIEQGAPEGDLDAYVAQEGVTAEDLQIHAKVGDWRALDRSGIDKALGSLSDNLRERARNVWAVNEVAREGKRAAQADEGSPWRGAMRRLHDLTQTAGDYMPIIGAASDEIQAAMNSAGISGGGSVQGGGGSYDTELAMERVRKANRAEGDETPLFSTPAGDIYASGLAKTLGVGAGVLLPWARAAEGASVGTQVGLGAAQGAGYGAAQGFLEGEGESDRSQRAGIGAGVGGAGGAALSRLAAGAMAPNAADEVAAAASRIGVRAPAYVGAGQGALDRAATDATSALGGLPIVGGPLRTADRAFRSGLDEAAARITGRAPDYVPLSQKAIEAARGVIGEDAAWLSSWELGGRALNVARRRSPADHAQLTRLQREVGSDTWDQIGGAVVEQMGTTGGGQFSLGQFARQYGGLTDSAKSALFGAGAREELDALALLTNKAAEFARVPRQNQFGRFAAVGAGLAGHTLYGSLPTTIAGLIGGRAVAAMASRPVQIRPLRMAAQSMLRMMDGEGTKEAARFSIIALSRSVPGLDDGKRDQLRKSLLLLLDRAEQEALPAGGGGDEVIQGKR